MCEPTLILSAVVGAGTTISGIQEQNRAHSAQVAHVNRQNAIAKQDYLNKISISAFNDQQKLNVFEAQLEGEAAEKEAYYKQREINQLEGDRAKIAAKMELQDKIEEAQLKGQEQLAASIRAQGTVLAGETVGGSMLLEAQQAERELGFATATIDAGLWNAEQQYAMKNFEIDMGQFAADAQATMGLSGGPSQAPTASFMTVKPMKMNAPKKPSILGPILSGVTARFTTYIGSSGFRGGGTSGITGNTSGIGPVADGDQYAAMIKGSR